MCRYRVFVMTVSIIALGVVLPSWAQDGVKADKKADLQALVQGNSAFACDLYGQLSKKEGNVVFSPYSISSALAMTYAGARGDTAAKMAKAVHFTLPGERLHSAFGNLHSRLAQRDQKSVNELYVANALWGQAEYSFVPEFLELTQKHYGAGLHKVDFRRNSEAARITINGWVSTQTKSKIPELLAPGALNEDTRLVLTNAIYLKAKWKTPFASQRKQAPFEVGPKREVSVPMMTHSAEKDKLKFNYAVGYEFHWLELPYQEDRLSMVLLLPREKGGLAALEKTLTPAVLADGVKRMSPQLGEVILPRFKVSLDLRLLDRLKGLGMDVGPLTHIAREELQIGEVIHKALVEVDEAGTVAVAATGVVVERTSLNTPFVFRADHPFVFLIRDTQTGSILFMGRVSDPSKQ